VALLVHLPTRLCQFHGGGQVHVMRSQMGRALCCMRRPVMGAVGARSVVTQRPDHLTRTAGEPRQRLVSKALIVQIREETPEVREITLEVQDKEFSFRPGNWVDFFIDGVEKVGGYSMSSPPSELPQLRLAVKRSLHPPAAWCHSDAKVGTLVHVKAGGSIHWDDTDSLSTRHLLLVAGGIGINPLLSVLEAVSGPTDKGAPLLQHVSMLYSAARPSDLAYRRRLEELAQGDPRINLELRVTRADTEWNGATGRIGAADLQNALLRVGVPVSQTLAFVCGPSSMSDELTSALVTLGLEPAQVRAERWW